MDNLHFTDEAIAGLIIQSILMIIIPVILFIVWKIKTHEKVLPVIIGAVTWLLFAIILKLAPAYFLLQADNPIAKTISGNIWYTSILAGVLAGVFEETGRFAAFKTVLRKYEHSRSSISYGIGHGGFESIYVGVQLLSFPLMGILINNGMGDRITAGMDEAMKATAGAFLENVFKAMEVPVDITMEYDQQTGCLEIDFVAFLPDPSADLDAFFVPAVRKHDTDCVHALAVVRRKRIGIVAVPVDHDTIINVFLFVRQILLKI